MAQISISTSNDADGQLRVEVTDSGVGIEADALPKIFDAFEQGGRTKLGGLGLGLAISKTLAEAHKGTITAESAGRNQGAKFSVYIPDERENGSAPRPRVLTAMPNAQEQTNPAGGRSRGHEPIPHQFAPASGIPCGVRNNVESALDLSTTMNLMCSSAISDCRMAPAST